MQQSSQPNSSKTRYLPNNPEIVAEGPIAAQYQLIQNRYKYRQTRYAARVAADIANLLERCLGDGSPCRQVQLCVGGACRELLPRSGDPVPHPW